MRLNARTLSIIASLWATCLTLVRQIHGRTYGPCYGIVGAAVPIGRPRCDVRCAVLWRAIRASYVVQGTSESTQAFFDTRGIDGAVAQDQARSSRLIDAEHGQWLDCHAGRQRSANYAHDLLGRRGVGGCAKTSHSWRFTGDTCPYSVQWLTARRQRDLFEWLPRSPCS